MDINLETVSKWIDEHGLFVASILGSATSSYFSPNATRSERLAGFIGGIAAAYCLGDIINKYLSMGEKTAGFLTGFFALNICVAMLKSIRRFGDNADFAQMLREYVQRSFGFLPPRE